MDAERDQEISAVLKLSVRELRLRYAELFGEATRTRNKSWLVKRVVWRLQALAEGDLLVVNAREEVAETLEFCRFLVSCGVLGREGPAVTDSQEETPKALGLHRRRQNVGRRSHSPLLVLVPSTRKSIVRDVLKAGADSCLMLPINAKDVASMLVRAQIGNQPGRHTLDLERAQTEDRWRDDGGQG